jgi:hypothetical protein
MVKHVWLFCHTFAGLLAGRTCDVDAEELPTPSTTIVRTHRVPNVIDLASQPPPLHVGRVAHGGVRPSVPNDHFHLLSLSDHKKRNQKLLIAIGKLSR